MLDTVKINHVQHISFTQSRLTDAVSVILSELLSYEHPSKLRGIFYCLFLRELPFVHHGGREQLAAAVTESRSRRSGRRGQAPPKGRRPMR